MSIELGPEDLTYFVDKTNEIKAGGFSIKSSLLGGKKPLLVKGGKKHSININQDEDKNTVSDQFNNMVIPAGLLYLHQSLNSANTNTDDYGTIQVCQMESSVPDDLYTRLVDLAELKEKEKEKKLSRNKKLKIIKTTKAKKTKRLHSK